MTKAFDLHFVNTICYPTKRNHDQIKEWRKKRSIEITKKYRPDLLKKT